MTARTPARTASALRDDTDRTGCGDRGAVFYHGTDPSSALSLANGALLSLLAARAHQANTASMTGFYLASDLDAAVYFASLHGQGVAILRYTLTGFAMNELLAAGATLGPVPRGAAIGVFAGTQLAIRPAQFRRFNALRRAGSIAVQPHRFGT